MTPDAGTDDVGGPGTDDVGGPVTGPVAGEVTGVVAERVEDVWRQESSHVLAALLRRHGDYGDCEDAAQEAMVAAVRQWPRDGVPDRPRAWLVTVASRRLVDGHRSQVARRGRETADGRARRVDDPVGAVVAPALPDVPTDVLADVGGVRGVRDGMQGDGATDGDDSLRLLLLCCHQSLTRPSQVALTLRAVAGLSVEQIAAASFVPARTMTQRLTRARSALRDAGARFTMPAPDDLPARVAAVLDVCHQVFNAGHLPASGDDLVDTDLAEEAIRLTRLLHDAIPDHDEVTGALALMLLTHARAPARTDDGGDLVPLRHQDRGLWDRGLVDEGVALLEEVLPRGHVGRHQLQAAIAAVHAEAATWADTDWTQVSLLYALLHDVAPGRAVTLNRAVAVAMARSVDDGLAMVEGLLEDPAMRRHHRTQAVRAHLLELADRPDDALAAYREAARLTASLPEQRYLHHQAERLTRPAPPRPAPPRPAPRGVSACSRIREPAITPAREAGVAVAAQRTVRGGAAGDQADQHDLDREHGWSSQACSSSFTQPTHSCTPPT